MSSSLRPFQGLLICLFALAWAGLPATALGQNGSDAEIVDLTFDDIKFEMDKDVEFEREFLTERIHELDGRWIRIRGYILPSFKQSEINKFILVRDNQECCFGPGAALCDCILVSLEKGRQIDYTVRPVTVEGKFYVKEWKTGGKVLAVFRMKNAQLR